MNAPAACDQERVEELSTTATYPLSNRSDQSSSARVRAASTVARRIAGRSPASRWRGVTGAAGRAQATAMWTRPTGLAGWRRRARRCRWSRSRGWRRRARARLAPSRRATSWLTAPTRSSRRRGRRRAPPPWRGCRRSRSRARPRRRRPGSRSGSRRSGRRCRIWRSPDAARAPRRRRAARRARSRLRDGKHGIHVEQPASDEPQQRGRHRPPPRRRRSSPRTRRRPGDRAS